MKILYFAWLRERLDRSEEELEVPAGVATVGGLIDHLARSSLEAEAALADRRLIRAAVDGEIVGPEAPLAGARTVALFPPMTGG